MTSLPESILQASGLHLRAGARTLVSALDWQVRAGEFWCVLGRNGIGKSTLLQTLAGLQPSAAGQIQLAGQALARLSPQQLARMRGLLLQQQDDAFSLPVVDAVMAGRFAHGSYWGDSEDERRIALQSLQNVGLPHLAGTDILKLSGGERQRVGLATLLAQAPSLYLLDEPTSHQDIAAQLEVMALLRTLADPAAGQAVIASCHDLNLARRFASHVLLIGEPHHWQGEVASVMQPAVLSQAFGCDFQLIGDVGQQWLVAQTR